jgi:hypothetical protein
MSRLAQSIHWFRCYWRQLAFDVLLQLLQL